MAHNSIYTMANRVKSKGNRMNVAQIVGCLGQQLLQHSRIPGRMAKAMAAAADVNQHARGS